MFGCPECGDIEIERVRIVKDELLERTSVLTWNADGTPDELGVPSTEINVEDEEDLPSDWFFECTLCDAKFDAPVEVDDSEED